MNTKTKNLFLTILQANCLKLLLTKDIQTLNKQRELIIQRSDIPLDVRELALGIIDGNMTLMKLC